MIRTDQSGRKRASSKASGDRRDKMIDGLIESAHVAARNFEVFYAYCNKDKFKGGAK